MKVFITLTGLFARYFYSRINHNFYLFVIIRLCIYSSPILSIFSIYLAVSFFFFRAQGVYAQKERALCQILKWRLVWLKERYAVPSFARDNCGHMLFKHQVHLGALAAMTS